MVLIRVPETHVFLKEAPTHSFLGFIVAFLNKNC